MRNLRIGCAIAALIAPVAALHAQDTAASIRGQVTTDAGVAVPNAAVVITHKPSGTRFTQTTDAGGNFNASGLRLGGPYEIAVTAPGFDPASETLPNLLAGTPQRITVLLAGLGQTINVVAGREKSAITLASGPATVLSDRDIAGVSTVNRDIRNLAARSPLVTLDPTNGGAISIAGQNNRFNRITVDGVAFGDPFGLESGGLASTRGPVPLDAIGEFSVEVAPVDIQQGFFQGGAINTQLKSGGNDFHGTAFYTYSGDALRGKTTRDVRLDRSFESQNFGVQLTGPIIKDKLFFAVSWERLRDTTPANITAATLGITQASVDNIKNITKSTYNYDTLDVPESVAEADDKVVAKIDWNIAEGHRAAFTYIYNKGNILAGQTGDGQLTATNPTLSLQSNAYDQGSVNHFGVFQLNDQWSDNFSTQLRVSYNDYVRLQQPYNGTSFGQFQVCLDPTNPVAPASGSGNLACSSGTRRIQFGPDISRQANELESQSLSVEFKAELSMNNHTVKFIAERRQQDIRNLFAQRVSGAWLFDSVADLSARRANELDFAVPLRGGIDTVTAEFQNNTWTAGIMDTWDATDALSITAGVRYDLFDTPDVPFFNQNFVDRTGFANTATLNGRGLFQPRIAAVWKASDRLEVRATAGLFGGGSPNVWISNNYSNPGPTLGRVQVRRADNGTFTISGLTGLAPADVQSIGAATLNNVTGGTGIPQTLINAIRTTGSAAAPTNELDPDFRVPSTWRLTGTLDYAADLGFLGDDWNLGVDVVYSRVKDALTWTDLRSVANGVLPDGRPRYRAFDAAAGLNNDMLLTNTDQGHSWNVVARVDKRWESGFRLGASYTFQRVKDVNSGTSSVALSNYNNSAAEDPNNAAFGIANYQRDDSYRLTVGYDKALFGDNKTRVELFFNSLSGQRYSYTFADQVSGSARSAVFGTTGTNNRYLMYVPNVASATADPLVTYAAGFDFTGFQSFVQNSELSKHQGKIAPKNIARAPRFNKLDLRLSQELPFIGRGKLEAFADFENLLNLINSDWGSLRQVQFPYYGTLVNVRCAGMTNASTPATACSRLEYSNRTAPTATNPVPAFAAPQQVINLQPSLWQIRVGARVRF